eukprot:jgi/Psemu1/307179/fgenesh1_kg.309_\
MWHCRSFPPDPLPQVPTRILVHQFELPYVKTTKRTFVQVWYRTSGKTQLARTSGELDDLLNFPFANVRSSKTML